MIRRIGNLTVREVIEGEGALPMTMALPGVTREDLASLRKWHWSEELSADPAEAHFKLAVRSYVLQVDGLNILIDACNGNDKQRSIPLAHNLQTAYLQRLAQAGLKPADIHLVLCTHLHADHVGWNTRLENGRWVPTFSNARYMLSRRDYEFYSKQMHEPFHREAYLDSVLPVVEAGLADIVESDATVHREIEDGVWLEDAAGHSPGSCIVNARRNGSLAVFTGDAFHHPVQLVRPDLHMFADEDPVRAAAVRRRLLDRYADSDTVFFPAHFCGDPAGHVRRTEGGHFRYEVMPA
jgi:glyoxylase-like metal-dependent hydrolase (beta-lactamase superfamily II)